MNRIRIIIVLCFCILILMAVGCKKDDAAKGNTGENLGGHIIDRAPTSGATSGAASESVIQGDGEMYPHANRIMDVMKEFGGHTTTNSTEEGSTKSFKNSSKAQYKEFIQKLKEMGFTENITDETTEEGISEYYYAEDKDGVMCEVKMIGKEVYISVFNTKDYIK